MLFSVTLDLTFPYRSQNVYISLHVVLLVVSLVKVVYPYQSLLDFIMSLQIVMFIKFNKKSTLLYRFNDVKEIGRFFPNIVKRYNHPPLPVPLLILWSSLLLYFFSPLFILQFHKSLLPSISRVHVSVMGNVCITRHKRPLIPLSVLPFVNYLKYRSSKI